MAISTYPWSITEWMIMSLMVFYFVTHYLIHLHQMRSWKKANIPFIRPNYLIGHKYFWSTVKNSICVPLDRIYKENKDKGIYGLFIGPLPVVIVKDQKLIRQVFVKNSSRTFATGFAVPESEVEPQYMINLTANEEKWKFGRTTLMPTFSVNWFQGPKFEIIKKAIHEIWENAEKLESGGSPMNASKVAETAILNVVSSAHFGIDGDAHAMKKNIQTLHKDMFEPSHLKNMALFTISIWPSLQRFDYFRIIRAKYYNYMSEILKYQMNHRDQMNLEAGDFIDKLRSLRTNIKSRDRSNKDSDLLPINEGLSIRQMSALGLVLVIAGTKTVSDLISFTIHALSLHPEYQRKIRKEVHEALKKHGLSELNFEVVRDLSFTIQCLFETARLYPLEPFFWRECSEDFQIPDTDYMLRKGDKVAIPLYSIGRDEQQFSNPESFNPERFESKSTDLTAPGTLLNFGIGLRKCPGYQQGLLVAGAIIASLLYNYDIKPRSHLKLMDASDFNPKMFMPTPKTDILVDLVRCKKLDDF